MADRGVDARDVWYILRVLSGSPLRIAERITELGYTAYCPKRIRERRHQLHRRASIKYEAPLFPGYLFVRTHDGGFHWSMIEDSNTRTRFLCVDDRCVVLSDRELAQVRSAEAAEALTPDPDVPKRPAAALDVVKILHGALYGRSATVLRIKGQRAEVALVDQGVNWGMYVRLDQLEVIEDGQNGQVAAESLRATRGPGRVA